jgi:CubicO group peptidase (beta-lactamase class C family)
VVVSAGARRERVDAVARRYVDDKRYAAIEWRAEANGECLTEGRIGHGASAAAPIPDDAIWRLYSMTKPIVSVLALMLIEEGRLRLYDPLALFDRRFGAMRVLSPDGRLEPAVRPILVEDLLTHRAGFSYEFITGCHVAPMYQRDEVTSDGTITLDEMMGRIAPLPLAFQPGSAFRYSVAVDVLAHVIERATQQPIDALLEERIFRPLGMTDTAFHVPASKRARLMPVYGVADVSEFAPLDPRPHELTLADANQVEHMYPCDRPDVFRRGGHGLFATLTDYLAFARMLLSGRAPDGEVMLSRKMLEMLAANRIPESQLPLRIGPNPLPGYGWGLGVRVMLDQGRSVSLTSVGEFGWSGAAGTYFWVDPAERMIGVMMTQYLASMLPLADDFRSAVYQMLE